MGSCSQEGDGQAETCREEHDRILDDIRTERDRQLEEVRVQSTEDQLEVMEVAKDELVVIQAQLEQELKNVREQRYDEIEKIMRKCEGGGEEHCPAMTLDEACNYCDAGVTGSGPGGDITATGRLSAEGNGRIQNNAMNRFIAA